MHLLELGHDCLFVIMQYCGDYLMDFQATCKLTREIFQYNKKRLEKKSIDVFVTGTVEDSSNMCHTHIIYFNNNLIPWKRVAIWPSDAIVRFPTERVKNANINEYLFDRSDYLSFGVLEYNRDGRVKYPIYSIRMDHSILTLVYEYLVKDTPIGCVDIEFKEIIFIDATYGKFVMDKMSILGQFLQIFDTDGIKDKKIFHTIEELFRRKEAARN